MKSLFKLRALYSNSPCNLPLIHVSKSQLDVSFSSKSCKKPRLKNSEETQMINGKEKEDFGELFDDITAILGTHNFNVDRKGTNVFTLTNNLMHSERNEGSLSCTEVVCKNANLNQEKEISVSLEETQTVERDASPIVHEVAKILRGGEGVLSIEKQLEDLGVEFDGDVVDKVLKRCFKVPDLALRFFNWVKQRDEFCHTTSIFNTMIYIAGESKNFVLVEDLLEEMERNLCKKDIKTWTILISHYGKARMIGKVLFLFEEMKKLGMEPGFGVYKVTLRSLCNSQSADIAIELYKEMISREMEPDMYLYKLLLHCLAHSGDIDSVHLVANDMIKISQIPEEDVYACVLKSFCISGRMREALEVIRGMKNRNIAIGSKFFEILVKGMCRADRMSDALEIVDILRSGVLDEKIYGIIVDGYLRRNNISKALEVFQSIKDCGQTPTVSTYTELLQHLFRSSQSREAFDLYNEMVDKGLKLDSVAITAVVAGYVQQDNISGAWKVLKSMEEKGIMATKKCYIIFIKELCKISRTDEVINVLGHMKASNFVKGNDIFSWVISHLRKKGETAKVQMIKQFQRASSDKNKRQDSSLDSSSSEIEPKGVVAEQVNSLSVPPKSFSDDDLHKVCKILSSSTDWCSKEEALENCRFCITPELVAEILKHCSRHGGAVLQFFSWVGKQAGYNHTTEAYNMAIKIAGQGKDFKHMRSLFSEMRRKRYLISSDTWTIMILQYGRIGLTEIALRIFREMKASSCNPNNSTYKSLIIALCGKKGRKVNEAIVTYKEMIQAGFVPDKELLEIYLGCLCEVDELLEAKQCAKDLCKRGFSTPLAYSLYIRALCRAGKIEEALLTVDEVHEKDKNTLNEYISGSLIHGLLRKGRLEEALERMESVRKAGISPTIHVYTSLLVYFFKEKQTGKALEVFEKMKEEGLHPTIVTYSALIRGYVSNGQAADAWNVFHKMKSEGPLPDFKMYSMFISCLCKDGRSEEALPLLSEMQDVGIAPSTVNFRDVFHGLNREGKQNLAQTLLGRKWDLIRSRKFLK